MITGYRLGNLITIPELAALLKVSQRTVRDWVYQKVVPYTKLRGRIYFSKELVEALLARGAREPLATGRPVGSPEAGKKPEEGGASSEKEDNDGS